MDLAGKNADEMFEDIGHSNEARKIMKTMEIGELKVGVAKAPDRRVPSSLVYNPNLREF